MCFRTPVTHTEKPVHPHFRALGRTGKGLLRRTSSHLPAPTAIQEGRSLSSRPKSWLSAFLCQILLCALLPLPRADLNEALNITPPRSRDSSGYGARHIPGQSRLPHQVWPGLHQICYTLPGATLSMSLFQGLGLGFPTELPLARFFLPAVETQLVIIKTFLSMIVNDFFLYACAFSKRFPFLALRLALWKSSELGIFRLGFMGHAGFAHLELSVKPISMC